MTSAARLDWDLDDVKFLFTVLEEVSDMLGRADTPSFEILWINPVKNVLGELLGSYRPSRGDGDMIDIYDSRHSFDMDCGPSSIPKRYDAWVDEWELGKLCQWGLDEVRAHCLKESERYKATAARLKSRCRLAPNPVQGAPIPAQSYNSSQGEGTDVSSSPGSISLLPVELLQQIFSLSGLPRHWVRAPLILSHVSPHFRSIVLNTPYLWASINDSLPSQILELYIARSANEPFEILTRTHYMYNKSPGWIANWFNFLTMKATRIQRITVLSDPSHLISRWGKEINKGITFTSVTKLVIRSISNRNGRAACPKWADFPCLRDLWIQGCWCGGWVGPEDPFPPTLQRLKLTKLNLVSLYTFLEALGGVLGLVSLVMEDFALDPDHGDPSPSEYQVTLPSLEKLEFTRVLVRDMNVISRHVSTPNLSSLSVTLARPSDRIADFLAPFTATHPQITSIRILEFDLEPQDLKVILHSLVNLTQLHIPSSNLTNDDLTALKEGTLLTQLTGFIS